MTERANINGYILRRLLGPVGVSSRVSCYSRVIPSHWLLFWVSACVQLWVANATCFLLYCLLQANQMHSVDWLFASPPPPCRAAKTTWRCSLSVSTVSPPPIPRWWPSTRSSTTPSEVVSKVSPHQHCIWSGRSSCSCMPRLGFTAFQNSQNDHTPVSTMIGYRDFPSSVGRWAVRHVSVEVV